MSEYQLIMSLTDRWLKDHTSLTKAIDRDTGSFQKAIQLLSELELHKLTREERFSGAALPTEIAYDLIKKLSKADEALAFAIGIQNLPLSLCLKNLKQPLAIEGLVSVVSCSSLEHYFEIKNDNHITTKKEIPAVPLLSVASHCLFIDQDQAILIDLNQQPDLLLKQAQAESLGMRAISKHKLCINQPYPALIFPISNANQINASLRILNLLIAYSSAEQANFLALKYAKERTQFGQALSQFQAIQWMLADNFTELRAMALSIQYAINAMDQEGFSIKNQQYQLCQSESIAAEAAFQICDRSLQIHGGYGYTVEYEVEKHWRAVQSCLSEISLWENTQILAELV
jgi:alkylation response protein AidB-like acyl-CoA dehydrogenase